MVVRNNTGYDKKQVVYCTQIYQCEGLECLDGATLTGKPQSPRSNIPYLKKASSALGRPKLTCLSEIVDSRSTRKQ